MLGRALGATQVIGVDTSQGRIDLARSLGLADEAFLSDAAALGKIKAATSGKGCEVGVIAPPKRSVGAVILRPCIIGAWPGSTPGAKQPQEDTAKRLRRAARGRQGPSGAWMSSGTR